MSGWSNDLTDADYNKLLQVILVLSVGIPVIMLIFGSEYWLVLLVTCLVVFVVSYILVDGFDGNSTDVETGSADDAIFTDKFARSLIEGEITVDEYEERLERVLNTAPDAVQSNKSVEVTVSAVMVEGEEDAERDNSRRAG